MAKRYVDVLYAAKAEVMKGLKKPLVLGKIDRALAGARDSYEDKKLDKAEAIEALYARLGVGDTSVLQSIVDAEMDIEELEKQQAVIAKVGKKLYGPAPKVEVEPDEE